MADNATSKSDAAAEKAYAEASAKKVSAKPAAEPAAPKAETVVETAPAVEAAKPATAPKAAAAKPAAKKAVKKAVAKPAPKKPAPKKPAPKTVAAEKPAPVKKAAPKKKAAAKKPSAKKPVPAMAKAEPKNIVPTPPVTKIKDTIMATVKTPDFTKAAKDMVADVQTKLEAAYAKTGELAGEVNEFSKANLEAVVESGKIFFAGLQELGREDIENGKDALETVTADMKKMAAAKTPTEFMQLQGELVRRNFDAAVSFGSKRTEALVKLYNDAFAPLSTRVSVAAEKIKLAA